MSGDRPGLAVEASVAEAAGPRRWQFGLAEKVAFLRRPEA
jgi:hypothetical protein